MNNLLETEGHIINAKYSNIFTKYYTNITDIIMNMINEFRYK